MGGEISLFAFTRAIAVKVIQGIARVTKEIFEGGPPLAYKPISSPAGPVISRRR